MKINVQNIAGCAEASLEVDGVAFIAGLNEAGKTSLCQGIAVTVSGTSEKLNKDELAEYVREGGGESFVEIIDDEQRKVRASFPTGKITKTGGWGIESSPYAVGLMSICDMPKKERYAELIRILKAFPSREEWIDALVEKGIEKAVADTTTNKIMKGATAAWEYFKEHGAGMKGRFKAATGGTQWGIKIGANWLPKNWSPTKDAKSIDTLKKELATEKQILEGLIQYKAVSEDELKRCEQEANTLGQRAAEAAQAATKETEAEKVYKAACDVLTKLPQPPKSERKTPCPHCDEPIVIVGSELRKPSGDITSEELQKILDDISAQEKVVDKECNALKVAQSEARRTQLAVSDAKRAEQRLAELRAEQNRSKPEGDVEAQRILIERLEETIRNTEAKTLADELHEGIVDNQKIIDVLAPDGLRQTKLAEALEDLNLRMAELCAIANWKKVRISEDMTITYGGKRYEGLATSTSGKYRTRIIFQLALAAIQESKLIVIDAADVMDKGGRGGLMQLLKATGVNAVVTMTYNEVGQVPNIQKLLGGKLYWLEDAAARLVESTVAA